MTVTAKPTRYKGHLFRSRLEARWAIVFEQMGIAYQYEAEGFDLPSGRSYLPDFWLPGLNTFVEIKAGAPSKAEKSKLYEVAEGLEVFWAFGMSLDNAWNSMIHGCPGNVPPRAIWPEGMSLKPTVSHLHYVYTTGEHESALDCPVCRNGEGFAHFGETVVHKGDYPLTDQGVCYRGPVQVTPIWHEGCGHTWSMVMAFHKGNTHLLRMIPADNYTPLQNRIYQLRDTERSFSHAIDAAKSARFEHGQSGPQ